MWKTDLEKPTHILASITCNSSLTKSRHLLNSGESSWLAGCHHSLRWWRTFLQLVYLLQLAKNGRQATIQLAVIVHSSVVWITSPTHHFYLQYYLQSLPPASCHLLPLQPLSHIITELEYHFWSEHHLCLQYTEEREREILYAKASLTSFSLTFHVRLSPLLNPLESSGL